VREDLAALARHCQDVGRPYGDIQKTLSTRLGAGDSRDAFIGRCTAAAALGIEHVVVITPRPWSTDLLATLAGAIPALHDINPG
jgi:hypothetical protein